MLFNRSALFCSGHYTKRKESSDGLCFKSKWTTINAYREPSHGSTVTKKNKAKVVRRTPFTIKLLVKTKEFVQPVTLGVDAGSKTIGLSASTETKEIFAAELKPRNDVINNLSTRREFRRARRNRVSKI